MSEDLLERLGNYFTHFNVMDRYGITFEQFVEKWRSGTWDAYLAA
ncbi:hypothetical protein [Paenibacillus psychroresistens]|nr:hypothetical protein [Paenibacillus psychroresistens]